MPRRPTEPVDYEARGRRRVWKSMAAARFQKLVEAFHSRPVAKAATELSRTSGRHVAAALVLKNAFDGLARIEAETTGRHAEILWSAIHVGPTPLVGTESHTLTYDEEQDCATVHFLVAGWPGVKLARALWSCVVTDLAIGRLLQRGGPNMDVDAAIFELHTRVLAIPEQRLLDGAPDRQLSIPAREGAFAVNLQVCRAVTTKQTMIIARARSWLPNEAIEDDRLERSAELLRAEPGAKLLAHSLLNPTYLYQGAKPAAATAA